MRAIYIPQLAQAPEQTELIEVKEFLPHLDTLTPIQGWVQVTHQGNYLAVSTQAETIVTLTCDRCLQQYNHRLVTAASELIWLEEAELDLEVRELELAVEDLIETLPPRGYFHLDEWLYEQLCLALPQQQLCDQQCLGLTAGVETPSATVDRRWAALEALKQLPTE